MSTPTRPRLWTALPEPSALLASCAANPPRRVHHRDVYAISADEWSEYSRRDPRVSRLIELWDEAFNAIPDGPDYRVRAGAVLEMTPEKAIGEAVALHGRGALQVAA